MCGGGDCVDKSIKISYSNGILERKQRKEREREREREGYKVSSDI